MLGMFFQGGAIYHNGVQIHDNEAVIEWLENLIYKYIEYSWGISKAK